MPAQPHLGLQLLPVMGGLLIASIGSGQLITRSGRYKVFPIVGTAVTVIGLYLLSLMDADTSVATASAYMFVLGLGLGLVMQVLVLAVQNAVPYSELGVATSGATLFRSIGGSFGASVLGAVFASQLTHNLAQAFPGQASPGGGHFDPSALAQLPPAVHDAYVHAFTDSLNVVFLVAAAIGVAAFALTWFIKELPLRDTVATASVGEAFAVPEGHRSARRARPRAQHPHPPRTGKPHPRTPRGTGRCRPGTGRDLAARTLQPRPRPRRPRARRPLRDRPAPARQRTARARRRRSDRGRWHAHRKGKQTLDTLISCGRDRLDELSDGWQPEQHPELRELIQGLARQFIDTPRRSGATRQPRNATRRGRAPVFGLCLASARGSSAPANEGVFADPDRGGRPSRGIACAGRPLLDRLADRVPLSRWSGDS